MPFWDFQCQCGETAAEVFGHRCDPDAVAPMHCGERMQVLLTSSRVAAAVFEPYETAHMHPDGKKLKVRNSGDLKRFQREFGVYRVDADVECRGGKFYKKSESKGRVYIT